MLGLHRIRQQVVEALAVVRRHLRAGVLQHHRSALLEQRQRAVRSGQGVVLSAGEHPQSAARNAGTHFGVRPDRGSREADLLEGGLRTADDDEVDGALRCKLFLSLREGRVIEDQRALPAALRRCPFRPASRQWGIVGNAVDPQHRRAVVRSRRGQGLAFCEGHAGLETEDERHRAPRHGPARFGLSADPVAEDRIIGQSAEFGGHVDANVRHTMPVKMKPPTRCKTGQGRGQSRQA